MNLGDLLFLLILLLPVLSRLFGKKPQPPRPSRPPVPPEHHPRPERQETRVEDPLSEALRQIREALGEPVAQPAPKPAEPPHPKPPTPAPPRQPAFRQLGAFEHDEHGFGRSNPLSEERFEQRPRPRGGVRDAPPARLEAIDLTAPLEVEKVAAPRTSDLGSLTRLRDPKRAREAFIMKEILDPPLSRRRHR